MNQVLHVSIRVNDPRRSAEMFARILDGEIRPTPLDAWGVVSVYTRGERANWLVNMLEFWPPHKHWHLGKMVDVDVATQRSYCHVAFICDKTIEELKPIAAEYGASVQLEERALDAPVPVLYDDLGNYFELFPSRHFA